MQTVTGRRKGQRVNFHWTIYDGLSRLWRSVLPFRHEVQRVDFQYPNSDFLSVLKRDPATVRRAHDGPSWGPSLLPVFSRNKVCCSKRLNRLLQKFIIETLQKRSSPMSSHVCCFTHAIHILASQFETFVQHTPMWISCNTYMSFIHVPYAPSFIHVPNAPVKISSNTHYLNFVQ